ncbi:hypothetical protein NLM27_32725 [Bradyrhizobium sp. CCGB12]|uniref:hypothetical protein n=1 Tax=Bradyrhizobium sp. CCGB12 TaxID=2949632 RepID=UPI0020B22E73|nr:hypothetical protein [Bradyrhizobium sp. CCGB12]MCP3393524.1 hypothetical protein [Bradyrhizobium sp. CCGB12]
MSIKAQVARISPSQHRCISQISQVGNAGKQFRRRARAREFSASGLPMIDRTAQSMATARALLFPINGFACGLF